MKKILTLVVVVALVATISVAGTLAWLTDTSDEVVNTFTVGKVGVTLDEDKTDAYGNIVYTEEGGLTTKVTSNKYHLIPGCTYNKKPTVHVEAGSEDCYVFIKVSNGIQKYEIKNPSIKTIAGQMNYYDWKLYSSDTENKDIYIYRGEDGPFNIVRTSNTPLDLTVFEKFIIDGEANTVEGWADIGATNAITIKACVVQAEGLTVAQAYEQAKTLLNAAPAAP